MADPGYNLSGRIPVDGTLVALLLPSIAISAIAIPGGFITFTLRRNTEGVASELVNSGATSNYYWLLLQYVPVIVTLTFATSMVYSGRVVAIAWAHGESVLLDGPTGSFQTSSAPEDLCRGSPSIRPSAASLRLGAAT